MLVKSPGAADKQEFKIEHVTHNEFVTLLKFIYPMNLGIDEVSVEVLLKLAKKFDVKSVFHQCDNFLAHDYAIPLERKLLFVDKYDEHIPNTCVRWLILNFLRHVFLG